MPAPRRTPRREAPLPVETDAVTVITVGTVIWVVALVVTLLLHDWLSDRGAGDWVWITVAGVGLGLLGIRIVRRRRARLLGEVSPSDPSTDQPAPNRL